VKTYVVSLIIVIIINGHYHICIRHRGTAAEYVWRHAMIQLQTTVMTMMKISIIIILMALHDCSSNKQMVAR